MAPETYPRSPIPGMRLAGTGFNRHMGDAILDVILPPTDRAVAIQWAVMAPFWLITLWATRRRSKEVRTFLMGLAMINLAWFAARTIH